MKPVAKEIDIKEGFFPSFVYLLPAQTILQEDYSMKIQHILKENKIQFKVVEELHLSLSRTFYPIFSEIAQTVGKCREAIKSKKINLPVILLFKKVEIL
jgi:hypothetical protein